MIIAFCKKYYSWFQQISIPSEALQFLSTIPITYTFLKKNKEAKVIVHFADPERIVSITIKIKNMLPKFSRTTLSYAAGKITAIAGLLVLIGWQFYLSILTSHLSVLSTKSIEQLNRKNL